MLSGGLPKLNSMQLLLGQSNFSSTRLCLRSVSVLASSSNSFIGNQTSALSVSGPTCYKPNKRVMNSTSTSNSLNYYSQGKSIAVSSFKTVNGDTHANKRFFSCANVSHFSQSAGVCFGDRKIHCDKTRMSLGKQEPINSDVAYGYFMFDASRRFRNFSTMKVGPCFKNFHAMTSSCYSTGAGPDVSFDSSQNEKQNKSTSSSNQSSLGERDLKLVSGSCYMPHPDKEETGGEDAHFICVDEQAIGIADGVGGWADVGVNAGLYAQELMSQSVSAIREEPKGSIDPARVLKKAHSSTIVKGSSTACIIALTDKELHAVNLGDSGFIVIRDGSIVFESPVQQHDFNFPYQLMNGIESDLPSSGQVFAIPVSSGDVIVAGTDGLFDNLFTKEVTAIVVQTLQAGLGPETAANKIAALARKHALDPKRPSPFSTAAQQAGVYFFGGKLDDVTVVVSYIT